MEKNIDEVKPNISFSDVEELFYQMGEDWHLWDESEKGIYPIERVFDALKIFVEKHKPNNLLNRTKTLRDMKVKVPKIAAISYIWDNEEKHMISCMDDYFKQGLPEIEIAICNDKTGKEIISATIKSENFYKSEAYLRHFPTPSPRSDS